MNPRLTVALAVLAVAGCLEAEPGSNDATPAAPAFAMEPMRQVFTYENAEREAFLRVSPDGRTMLTCLHGEFTRPSFMLASEDGGATFRELVASPSPPAGGDCEVALSPDGAWSFIHSLGFGATVATTTDGGGSWIVNPVTALPTSGFADRPWMTFDGETLLMAYMPLLGEPGGIGFTRSTDYGRTWSLSRTIAPMDPEFPYIRHGHFLHGPDGAVRAFVMRMPTSESAGDGPVRFSLLETRDQGATWAETDVAVLDIAMSGSAESPVTGSAQDGDGNLYLPYYIANGDGYDWLVLASRDGGASWDEPVTLLSGLGYNRAWIGDGRHDASVDITVQVEGERVGASGPYAAVARIRLDPFAVDLAPLLPGDAPEYVGIDHDAAGRAYVVLPVGGFRVLTLGQLFFSAEASP